MIKKIISIVLIMAIVMLCDIVPNAMSNPYSHQCNECINAHSSNECDSCDCGDEHVSFLNAGIQILNDKEMVGIIGGNGKPGSTSSPSPSGCSHDYSSATCTSPAKCSKCSATTGSALGHNYSGGSCTTPSRCTRCSAMGYPTGSHSFSSATCTSPSRCSRCSATSGSALGHNFSSATCTSPSTCSRCSATSGSALGHNYIGLTCTTPGRCTRCSAMVYPSGSHSFSGGTCTTPAKCTKCGALGGAPGHNFSSATCTSPSTCSRCSTTSGSALGHNFTGLTCTTPGRCTRCSAMVYPIGTHNFSNATCTSPATCSRCNATSGSALGHDPSGLTCTTPGKCTRCPAMVYPTGTGHSFSGGTCTTAAKCTKCNVLGDIPGHDFSDATCTSPKTCSRCNATTGSALGHNFIGLTCNTPGKCERCQTMQYPTGSAVHTYAPATCTSPEKCTRCGITSGSALGHTPDTPATCTVPVKCKVCDVTLQSALEHDFTGWTCTTQTKCSRCPVVKEPTVNGHTFPSAICTEDVKCEQCPATGKGTNHDFAGWTCTTQKKCSRCPAIKDSTGKPCDFTPATCTEPAICGVCKKTVGKALDHYFKGWTCNKEVKCDRCPAIKSPTGNPCDYAPATCIQPSKCRVCWSRTGSVLKHNYNIADGKLMKCICGAVETESHVHYYKIAGGRRVCDCGLVVPNGTRTPEEAADWVESCVGATGFYMPDGKYQKSSNNCLGFAYAAAGVKYQGQGSPDDLVKNKLVTLRADGVPPKGAWVFFDNNHIGISTGDGNFVSARTIDGADGRILRDTIGTYTENKSKYRGWTYPPTWLEAETPPSTRNVLTPNYTIMGNKLRANVAAGDTEELYMSLEGQNNFDQYLQFSATNIPAGFTVALDRQSIKDGEMCAISVVVPDGCPDGEYTASLESNNGDIVGITLTAASTNLAPYIESISSYAGFEGQEITIFGGDFGVAGTVTISGTPMEVREYSKNKIVARIPQDAVSGNIIVESDGKQSAGVLFSVQHRGFEIMPSKASVNIGMGRSASIDLDIAGYEERVDLSIQKDSELIEATLEKTSILAEGKLSLALRIAENTPPGRYEVTIRAAGTKVAISRTIEINVENSIQFVTQTLPETVEGFDYSAALEIINQTGKATFSIIGGNLPEGIYISADGEIYGIPIKPETARFKVKVADEGGKEEVKDFEINVSEDIWAMEGGNQGKTRYKPTNLPVVNSKLWTSQKVCDTYELAEGKIITGKGMVYVLIPEGVTALHKETGEIAYKYRGSFKGFAYMNGKLLVLDNTCTLHVLDSMTGAVKWEKNDVELFSNDETRLYVLSQGQLLNIEPETGGTLHILAQSPYRPRDYAWHRGDIIAAFNRELYLLDQNGMRRVFTAESNINKLACDEYGVVLLLENGKLISLSNDYSVIIERTCQQNQGEIILTPDNIIFSVERLVLVFDRNTIEHFYIEEIVNKVAAAKEKAFAIMDFGIICADINTKAVVWTEAGRRWDMAISGQKLYVIGDDGRVICYGSSQTTAARIDFTTSGDSTVMRCDFDGSATAVWHWADGTTTEAVSGASVSKTGLGAGEHQNYLIISDNSAITRFGAADAGQGNLVSISGLQNCSNMGILFAYMENALTSIGDTSSSLIREYHLMNTGLNTVQIDEVFADAVASGVQGGILWADNSGTVASNSAKETLQSRGWTLNIPAWPQITEARIDFTTSGDSTVMRCDFDGSATAVWYWADGTTTEAVSGASVNKVGLGDGEHQNYLIISDNSAITRFGAADAGQGNLVSISGLQNCSNMGILFAYMENALTSIGDTSTSLIREYHLMNTGLNTVQIDEVFADAVASGVQGGILWADNSGTVASNSAKETLQSRGWTLNIPAWPQITEARIDFTTSGDSTVMRCDFDGSATAVWYWADGTTTEAVSGASVSKVGLGDGEHQNYLIISDNSAITRFGAADAGQGNLVSISGLQNCSNMGILFAYMENALTSIGDTSTSLIREYHLMNTGLNTVQIDEVFADAVASGVQGGILWADNSGTVASNSAKETLQSRGWTLNIPAWPQITEARIDFTTSGDSTLMRCDFDGSATAVWHWADGTTTEAVSGASVSKTGLGAGEHQNYLIISDNSAITRFGAADAGQGNLVSISGLQNCSNMGILFAYMENALTSIGDTSTSLIREYHLMNTGLNTVQIDEVFADAVASGVQGGILWADNSGTVASNSAKETLQSRGWTLNIPAWPQ